MDQIEKLASYFKEFPGIGERQAKRFVHFIMQKNPAYVQDLASMISAIRKNVSQCEICFHFFSGANKNLCDICANPSTDMTSLMVVEKDADYDNIRKSGIYSGRYFILGGLVPIVDKETRRRIRVQELEDAIKTQATSGLKEVVLALSLSPHGEHTDFYLRELLSPLAEKLGLTITSLGRGLSTGTELEYSDSDTIKNALQNRK